jgi:hypothetical protein
VTVALQNAVPSGPVTVAVYVVVCATDIAEREPFGVIEPTPLFIVAPVTPEDEVMVSVTPCPAVTVVGLAVSVHDGAACAPKGIATRTIATLSHKAPAWVVITSV